MQITNLLSTATTTTKKNICIIPFESINRKLHFFYYTVSQWLNEFLLISPIFFICKKISFHDKNSIVICLIKYAIGH